MSTSTFSNADFLLNPRIGAAYFESHPLCELNLLDPRLGAAARLAVEGAPAPGESFVYHSHSIYTSVPYASWVRLESPPQPYRAGLRARSVPWRSRHPRKVLIAAAFGVRETPRAIAMQGPEVHALRTRLRDLCIAANKQCSFLRSPGFDPAETAALYWNSVFCLMPAGDDVTRKATMDAMLLGCIPVFFHAGQLPPYQWAWHWGQWYRGAVVWIDYRKVVANVTNPITALSTIDSVSVEGMQAIIAQEAHRLHYSVNPGTTPDAFDVTLQALHRRARSRELARNGTQQQQGPGRVLERGIAALTRLAKHGAQGICRKSSGAFGNASCALDGLPIEKLRPFVRERVQSIEDCLGLCRRCHRCRYVSYSQILQHCAWQHTCNLSRLDQRYEFWSYQSFTIDSIGSM